MNRLEVVVKKIKQLRIKIYAGQSSEDTDKSLHEIEQILIKAITKLKKD